MNGKVLQRIVKGLNVGWQVRLAGVGLMFLCAAGCSTSVSPFKPDIEYAKEMSAAHSDSTGKEIVGIWVSKFRVSRSAGVRETMLLRSDGTGKQVSMPPVGFKSYYDLKWRYEGAGQWSGVATHTSNPGGPVVFSFTARYDGKNVLFAESWKVFELYKVFVPADDDAAVNEHLKKRRTDF